MRVPLFSRNYGFRLSKAHSIGDVDEVQMQRRLRARRIKCERPSCEKLAVGMSATRIVAYLCDDDLIAAEDIQMELATPIIKILAFWTEWYMTHEYRGPAPVPGTVVIAPSPTAPLIQTAIEASSGADKLELGNKLATVPVPVRNAAGTVTLPPFMVF